MNKIHLIMPMGGKGSRFADKGFDYPKPLIEIAGKPFFFWSVQSVAKFMDIADITFVVLKEHMDKYAIGEEIQRFYPQAHIVVIPEVLNGAVLTCMEGIKEINDDRPLLFNDCDHMFRSSAFEKFMEKQADKVDGGLLTFWGDEPKYSFLKFDDSGNVTETVEKQVISNDAICGCYYFRNKNIFMECAKLYLEECSYQEFYVSGVYNIMAERGSVIKAFPTDFHIPYGTPEEYEEAKKGKQFEELL